MCIIKKQNSKIGFVYIETETYFFILNHVWDGRHRTLSNLSRIALHAKLNVIEVEMHAAYLGVDGWLPTINHSKNTNISFVLLSEPAK